MKRIAFTLTAVAVVFTCGLTYGQQTADEPNLEHDNLKVLEPLIGTWRLGGDANVAGPTWEAIGTISWSDSKKMIVSEVKARGTDGTNKLANQEFKVIYQEFYVWNTEAKRIEFFSVVPSAGGVFISEAKIDAKGVISYPRIRSTKGPFHGERTDTITANEWTIKHFNRKDDKGEAQEDLELKLERVEKGR